MPQTGWFKTTEMYFSQLWKLGSPKSQELQGLVPDEGSRPGLQFTFLLRPHKRKKALCCPLLLRH